MSDIFSCQDVKPQMDLLFAGPFRPINDATCELTTVIPYTKPPEWMHPLLALSSSPLCEWRQIHPLCNPAFIVALVWK